MKIVNQHCNVMSQQVTFILQNPLLCNSTWFYLYSFVNICADPKVWTQHVE